MHYHNHTATQLTFGVANYNYTLFMLNGDYVNGFTANNISWWQNSSLTAQVGGLYQAVYSAIGDGENNDVYVTSIFVNDINIESCDSHKKMAAGGDIVTMNGNCFIELEKGDDVQLKTQNYGGTGVGNYYGANINLVRISN